MRSVLGIGVVLICLVALEADAEATIDISPYVSIGSTKTLKPAGSGKEKEKIKQRQTVGLRFTLGLFRALKFQFDVGQNKLTTTEKTQEAVDDFDEIDFQKDLDLSTDEPDKEIKITETQNLGKASFVIDPRFKYLIMRVKLGVTARQRILETKVQGEEAVKLEPDPTYKPHATAGLGIRFARRTFALAEYGFYFFKFPETEPFERSVTVSFGVSI